MVSAILLFISCLSRFNRHPIEVIQQKGQQLYQSGDYQKAYRLFVGLQELQYQQQLRSELSHWQRQHHHQFSLYYQIKCLLHLGKRQQALNACYIGIKTCPSSTWYQLATDIYIQDGRIDLALNAVSTSYLLCDDDDDGQQDDMKLQKRILYERYLHNRPQQQQPQEQQQYTPGRADMVDILSYDIVCSIFMLLPLKTLVICCRVNTTWRSLILSNPLFWQHLDFHECHYQRRLSNATIHLYLSRLGGVPLRSILVHNEQDSQGLLKSLSESNCSELSELDWTSFHCKPKECWPLFSQLMFSAGKTLTKLRLRSSWFKLNDLMQLISVTNCPCLITLDVYDCFAGHNSNNDNDHDDMNSGTTLLPSPLSLRYFGLSGIHGLTAPYINTLLQRCPHLIEFTLHNCLVNINPIIHLLHHTCPRLERFAYHQNKSIIINERELNPSSTDNALTQQLDNDNNRIIHTNHRLTTSTNNKHNPDDDHTGHTNWTSFIIQQTHALTNDLLHTVLDGSYHTIQILDLHGHPRLTDHCIFNMMNHQQQQQSNPDSTAALSCLKECSLANCLGLTKAGLCLLIENAPQLRQLDLSGLYGVTDAVLLSLALCCPRLSILKLAHCRSITDQGMRCFIDTFSKHATPPLSDDDDDNADPWLLQELDLTDTNLSMECLAYVMCFIQRDGI